MGSSANTTAGRVTSARAIATRCCWPPESSDGRWVRRSSSPTVSISVSTHAWSTSRPAIVSGSVTFSSAVSTGQQVEGLEDEADLLPAQLGQALVVEVRDLDAVDLHGARRGPVEPGEAVHERRLAGAGRAHDRAVLTALEADRDAVEGVHGGLAVPEELVQVGGGDDRRALHRPAFLSCSRGRAGGRLSAPASGACASRRRPCTPSRKSSVLNEDSRRSITSCSSVRTGGRSRAAR